MHAQYRFAERHAQRARHPGAHQQRAGQARTARVGHYIDLVETAPSFGEYGIGQRQHAPDVVPAGQFGHHAAIGLVHVDLAVQRVRQQDGGCARTHVDQRNAGFVAGRFDAENQAGECGISHGSGVLSTPRGMNVAAVASTMNSGLTFLIAARRCEIEELDQLAHTGELVGVIGRLVHALQKERGISNVFLASAGARFASQREWQIQHCLELEHEVRASFDRLETEVRHGGNGTRLFSRVAWVLPGLAALPDLRRRIGALSLQPAQATAAFVKLIAGLLAVVFEAADGATDPDISRLLVAMFNFMQGKELTGQERAFGSAAFATGAIDAERQQQWLHLIESQDRCFQVFADFSDEPLAALWRGSQPASAIAERERLRRIATAAPAGGALDTESSQHWFDVCSQCVDAMKAIEERLATHLKERCADKITQARGDLESYRALLDTLRRHSADLQDNEPPVFFDDISVDTVPVPYGRQLERSILDMVQEQSKRLQSMSAELETVRATLNERKLVERAKGLLMAHRRLTEEEAHKMLRQTAMNQNRRLVEVAESVLSLAEYLPPGA